MPYADANWQRAHFPAEDLYGHDRLARALLRTVVRLAPGDLVAIHGAPGSGKSEFLGPNVQQDELATKPHSAASWLKGDPLLAEHLEQHTDELVRDIDGVYWMENLLLAAGL